MRAPDGEPTQWPRPSRSGPGSLAPLSRSITVSGKPSGRGGEVDVRDPLDLLRLPAGRDDRWAGEDWLHRYPAFTKPAGRRQHRPASPLAALMCMQIMTVILASAAVRLTGQGTDFVDGLTGSRHADTVRPRDGPDAGRQLGGLHRRGPAMGRGVGFCRRAMAAPPIMTMLVNRVRASVFAGVLRDHRPDGQGGDVGFFTQANPV